jgi:hypothetical protein
MIGLSFVGAMALGSPPAAAIEYPYCIQGGDSDIRVIAPIDLTPNAGRRHLVE